MNRLDRVQRSLMKKSLPVFEIGDTVRVHVKVAEGDKERIQVFEGVVIGRKGSQNTESFKVRKISYGVGVERVFPLHAPTVTKIDVVRQGKVRRAKLYYLRAKKGKEAKVVEREFVQDRVQATAEAKTSAVQPDEQTSEEAVPVGKA